MKTDEREASNELHFLSSPLFLQPGDPTIILFLILFRLFSFSSPIFRTVINLNLETGAAKNIIYIFLASSTASAAAIARNSSSMYQVSEVLKHLQQTALIKYILLSSFPLHFQPTFSLFSSFHPSCHPLLLISIFFNTCIAFTHSLFLHH